jgi:hypothetical protein
MNFISTLFTNEVWTHLSLWVVPWVWSRYPKNTNKIMQKNKRKQHLQNQHDRKTWTWDQEPQFPTDEQEKLQILFKCHHLGQQPLWPTNQASSHFILLALLKINRFCVNSVHTFWKLSFLENYHFPAADREISVFLAPNGTTNSPKRDTLRRHLLWTQIRIPKIITRPQKLPEIQQTKN